MFHVMSFKDNIPQRIIYCHGFLGKMVECFLVSFATVFFLLDCRPEYDDNIHPAARSLGDWRFWGSWNQFLMAVVWGGSTCYGPRYRKIENLCRGYLCESEYNDFHWNSDSVQPFLVPCIATNKQSSHLNLCSWLK